MRAGTYERLPISWQAEIMRVSPAFLVVAFLAIRWPGLWVVGMFALLIVLWAMSTARALVLDESGFAFVPLLPKLPFFLPRSRISWTSVERFVVRTPTTFGRAPRRSFVRYYQSGDLRRRGIPPVYALDRFARALNADELCEYLNEHLATIRPA